MKGTASSGHCHLDVYVFTVSNFDSINESKVYYIDRYLRVHALFQCCINLLFGDCLLCRHGSIYYYIELRQNVIKTLSAKQGFKILLKGRVEDPYSFGCNPLLAHLDHLVYGSVFNYHIIWITLKIKC